MNANSFVCKGYIVCLNKSGNIAFLVKYVWNTNMRIVYNYYVKTIRNFLYC